LKGRNEPAPKHALQRLPGEPSLLKDPDRLGVTEKLPKYLADNLSALFEDAMRGLVQELYLGLSHP
jgi:hypothetical protein